MAKNHLFNFLNMANSLAFQLPQHIKKVNLKAEEYFFLPLAPIKFSIKLGETNLNLSSHHISVYANFGHYHMEDLGQYHYTADFADEKNIIYVLHVFFDKRDKICKDPVVKLVNSITPIDISEAFLTFCQLAKEQSYKIIQDLKAKLQAEIHRLTTEYKAIELKLEAENLSTDEYNLLLQQLKTIVTRINLFSKQNQYRSIFKFFSTIAATQQDLKEDEGDYLTIDEFPADNPKKEAHEEDFKFRNHRKKYKQRIHFTDAQSFQQQLEKLQDNFTQCKAKIEKIEDITAEDLEFFLNLRANAYQLALSPQGINQFHSLKKIANEINHYGELLLPRLLLIGNFSLAAKLKAFHYLLDHRLFNISLLTNNHTLLDFLLTHAEFNIDDQPIVSSEKTYACAIVYCYERASTANLVLCFEVLLKHNANLLKCNSKGIPYIHFILQNPDHPFHSKLDDFLILNSSKAFYHELINLLQSCLSDGKLSPEEKFGISRGISSYIEDKKDNNPFFFLPGLLRKIITAKKNEFISEFKNNFSERLEKDNEVTELLTNLAGREKKLFAILKAPARKKIFGLSRSTVNSLKKFSSQFDVFSLSNDQGYNYEAIKKSIVAYMKNLLSLLDMEYELYIVNSGHSNKKTIDRSKELFQQISEIKQKNAEFERNLEVKTIPTLTNSDYDPSFFAAKQDKKEQLALLPHTVNL